MPNQVATLPFWDGQRLTDWGGLTADQWETMFADANCLPANVYGPVYHTLFLGCSVVSFTSSVGWNEQVGDVTVQLVQDTCSSASGKLYWDSLLQPRIWTDPDPGFIGKNYDIMGCPVYFRVNNFEFSGIIQSWEESNSTSGNPIYTVKISDPRQIVEGAQLIVGEYGGSVTGDGFSGPYNVFNVYGYLESLGMACPQTYLQDGNLPTYEKYLAGDIVPDGAMFGSEANGFGGASVNDNGMQWSKISAGINALINTNTTSVWSPHGGLKFRGTSGLTPLGFGLMPGDSTDGFGPFTSLNDTRWLSHYYLDISELPTPPSYWRIGGSNTSVLTAITDLLEDAGYDYYMELIPVRYLGGITKFIKIRTVRRLLQPTLGQIPTFIGNSAGTVSTTQGQELRNETTASFIIGGKKNTYYQIESDDVNDDNPEDGDGVATQFDDDTILPYFGTTGGTDNADYANAIIPYKKEMGDGEMDWHFIADGVALDNSLKTIDVNVELGTYDVEIGERELLAAISGMDTWLMFVSAVATDTGTLMQALNGGGVWSIETLIKLIDLLAAGEVLSRDMIQQVVGKMPLDPNAARFLAGLQQGDWETIFAWVSAFATEYYGKKFQVRVPFTCARQDDESDNILTSESPTQAGWTDQPYVLGLANSRISPLGDGANIHALMTVEDGRTDAMVRYENPEDGGEFGLDVTGIAEEDMGHVTSPEKRQYIRASVETEYVYEDKANRLNPRVVVSIPTYIKKRHIGEQPGPPARLLFQMVDLNIQLNNAQKDEAKARIQEAITRVGNKMAIAPLEWPMIMPEGIGFGIQSNVLTYGPWSTPGPAGVSRVLHEDGLSPWEYGGYDTMNLAGQSKSDEGITYMQIGERGSIEVAGYPTIPLGAELGAVAGGFYGAGTNLIENRVVSIDGGGAFSTAIGGWTGIYGPNVTDISVSVGTDGFKTSYNMRTETPKYGRFSKQNAQALKKVGTNRLKTQREASLLQVKAATRLGKQKFKENPIKALERHKNTNDKASPHELLVGALYPFKDGYSRTAISTLEMKEISTQMVDYNEKSFMGFEGLIRPISMDGGGGQGRQLPQYASYTPGCNVAGYSNAKPPIFEEDSLTTELHNERIDQDMLNPFSNPISKNRSSVGNPSYNRSKGGYVGHDMDLLAAGTGIPEGVSGTGINMQIAGYEDSTGSNYDDDYRAFALRGPLLVQQWGYDTNGKPIPNYADSEVAASGGLFTEDNLHCAFMENWLRKPHTWPVAPVDLRFDRKRGVWVSPPAYDIIDGVLQGDLCSLDDTCVAKVYPYTDANIKPYTNCDGEDKSVGYVEVRNLAGLCYPSGSNVLLYYHPGACQYIPLESKALEWEDQDCGGSTVDEGFLCGTLTVGTGLSMIDLGCPGGATLNSNISVSGPVSCDAQTGFGPTIFENLTFGSGFVLTDNGNCEVQVDVCVEITGIGGSGVQVENDSTCVTTCDAAGETYSKIIFGAGLCAQNNGNDSNVGLKLDWSDVDCDGDLRGTAGFLSKNLMVGTGLAIQGDCDGVYIRSDVKALGPNSCGKVDGFGPSVFDKLKFGNGFVLSSPDPCQVEVSLCAQVSSIEVDNSDTCITTCDAGGESYQQITFGEGLCAENDGSNVNVGLQLGFPCDPISSIALGDGLSASCTDCEGTISLDGTVATGVPIATGLMWFVTDVWCEGTAIMVAKSYIEWNSYGMIVGTGM